MFLSALWQFACCCTRSGHYAECLELAQWGIKSINELSWLKRPPPAHFEAATQLLHSLDLLTETGQLTAMGQQAAQWGINPRLAKMLIAAQAHSAILQSLACDIAALLIEGEVLQSPADADLVKRLLALQTVREAPGCQSDHQGIRQSQMRQTIRTATLLRQKLGVSQGIVCDLTDLQTHTGRLLASAFPDRIAQRRPGQTEEFKLSNGKGASLPSYDPLCQSSWLVVAEVDGQRQSGRIYLAAPITQKDIEAVFASKIICEPVLQYDAKNQVLKANEHCRLGRLRLSETPKPSSLMSNLKPWNNKRPSFIQRLPGIGCRLLIVLDTILKPHCVTRSVWSTGLTRFSLGKQVADI